MIDTIEIQDIATFSERVIIDKLKKINIIYGANGTGKSTISRVLNNISEYPSCKLSWQDDTPLQVLTYNKEFRDNNYVEHMPGIFTLGEATKETLDEIATKRGELQNKKANISTYKKDLEKKKTEKEEQTSSLRNSAWNEILKTHEDYFSKTAIKAGTKDNFLNALLSAYKSISKSVPLNELKEKASVLFGQQPLPLNSLQEIDNSSCKTIEKADIWAKVIVGADDVDIAGLIKTLGNADWVNHGLRYIQNTDMCPFCQQHTIDADFRKKLSLFFNEEYNHSIRQIKDYEAAYKDNSNNVLAVIRNIIQIEKNNTKSLLDFGRMDLEYTALKNVIETNIERINTKLTEPSRVINLLCTDDIVNRLNDYIKQVNDKIEKQNNLVANFGKEKNLLVNAIWNHFANLYKEKLASYNSTIEGVDKAINALEKKSQLAILECSQLEAEIQALENNVTSIKPTINEINKQLKSFGFTNFSICEATDNPNYYQIVRENGELAKDTLSEGESTFITFLYYMQLAKGSSSSIGIHQDRVLVIDDPVSSLDSNVLFVVSTILRAVFDETFAGSRTKQIFLLTHNVYFHKEVSFMDKHCRWRDTVSHYILRKCDNQSSINNYGKNTPIKSSYDLLWSEYMNASMTSHAVIQNVMRRIIENYFQMFGGYTPDAILEKFDNPEERQICKSLLSWINDGSHSLADDLYVEIPNEQIDKYKEVFRKIFEVMGHLAHYEMMTRMPDKEDASQH